MSTTENVAGKNAFSVMMTKKTTDGSRRSFSVGTEFVVCPVGCGKRMLEKDINQHLDQCIQLQNNGAEDSCEITQTQGEESSQEQSVPSSQLLTQPTSGMKYGRSMMSSKKRRRVICPSCQNAFPSALINLHLDQCITRSKSSSKGRLRSPESTDKNITEPSSTSTQIPIGNASICAISPSETEDDLIAHVEDDVASQPIDSQLSDVGRADVEVKQDLFDSNVNETIPSDLVKKMSSDVPYRSKSKAADPNSAFATMMKQSKAMFGKKDKSKPPLHLSFHLDESLRVRLSYPMTVETEWTPPVWSVLMNVRDKFSKIPDLDNPNQPSSIKIEVTVSTDLPSYINQPIRWVRYHSQLSVPVLKSILQKSIRRRKPLPAVRVAMELADKALGELLRRLPVIMFEDSYLHPDLNLLIWTMMAFTKDYQPSSKVMIRIFQIIYEIASCQWSDPLSNCDLDSNSESAVPSVTLTSLFKRDCNEINPTAAAIAEKSVSLSSSSFDDGTTYIWSMLVRAEYGGLQCDIHMLHRYAKVWEDRFAAVPQPIIPDTINQQLLLLVPPQTSKDPNTEISSTLGNPLHWSNVPTYLHKKARERSLERVVALCNQGVDRLVFEDICIEGIDYHCSGVIKALLSDEYLCGICFDLMTLAETSLQSPTSDNDDRRTTDLENILKVIIWNFNSNINYRRPLLLLEMEVTSTSKTKHGSYIGYTGLWNDLVASRVLEYQKNYVQQRMAR